MKLFKVDGSATGREEQGDDIMTPRNYAPFDSTEDHEQQGVGTPQNYAPVDSTEYQQQQGVGTPDYYAPVDSPEDQQQLHSPQSYAPFFDESQMPADSLSTAEAELTYGKLQDIDVPDIGIPQSTSSSTTLSSSSSSKFSKLFPVSMDFTSVKSVFDEEFQTLMKIIEPDITILKEADTFDRLSGLVSDFRHAALTYGRVIIAEKHLSDEEKSIKPITTTVGGYAGGEKYITNSIFFRFPLDVHGLYGGEEFAAKEANHQMKGLTAMFNADVGFNLPLLAVIEYHGYKLVAMSVLPIQGDKTLCYGSRDGGVNILSSGDGIDLMERAAKALNLCEHPVRLTSKDPTNVQFIHMPTDMEVHCIRDDVGEKRYYVVDFARLFPPQPPATRLRQLICGGDGGDEAGTPTRSCSHLYYMLRPELVRRHKTPLSSDAFSNFASKLPEHAHYNEEVVAATEYLITVVIPEFGRELDSMDTSAFSLASGMHNKGINMRFLGVLFQHVKSYQWKRKILLEATTRIIKAMVRGEMRVPPKSPGVITPYIKNVTRLLNTVLGRTPCRNDHGTSSESKRCSCMEKVNGSTPTFSQQAQEQEPAKKTLARSYSSVMESEIIGDLDGAEAKKRMNMWCKRIPNFLRERFSFCWHDPHGSVHDLLVKLEWGIFPSPTCYCCICLFRRALPPSLLIERIKTMCNLVFIENDKRQTMFDMHSPFQDYDITDFEASISVLPIMEYAQGTSSLIRSKIHGKAGNLEESVYLRSIAKDRFVAGLKMCPTNTRLLTNLGMVVEEEACLQEARDMYVKGIQSNPLHGRSWYYLARVLQQIMRQETRAKKSLESNEEIKEWEDRVDRMVHDTETQLGSMLLLDKCITDEVKNPMMRLIQVCFEKATSLIEDNPDWIKEYANFFMYMVPKSTGSSECALNLYKRVLRLEPNHTLTLKNMGLLYIGRAQRFERSKRKSAEEALDTWKLAIDTHYALTRVAPLKPMYRWNLAKSILCGYICKVRMNLAVGEDDDSINKAIEEIRIGFSNVKAFEQDSRGRGYQCVRLFDEGFHANICRGSTFLLSQVAKKLAFCFVAKANSDVQSPLGQQIYACITDCFNMVKHVCECEIDNMERPHEFFELKCKQYIDHCRTILNICGKFSFDEAADIEELRIFVEQLRPPAPGGPNDERFREVEILLSEFKSCVATSKQSNKAQQQQKYQSFYLQYQKAFFEKAS